MNTNGLILTFYSISDPTESGQPVFAILTEFSMTGPAIAKKIRSQRLYRQRQMKESLNS